LSAWLFQDCFEPAMLDRNEKVSCGIHLILLLIVISELSIVKSG
jgi:hypothetical protein